jgi:hypothetical protein
LASNSCWAILFLFVLGSHLENHDLAIALAELHAPFVSVDELKSLYYPLAIGD